MSLYTRWLVPDDVLMELTHKGQEVGFLQYLEDSAKLGYKLEYIEDQDLTQDEFNSKVRQRFSILVRAWQIHKDRTS